MATITLRNLTDNNSTWDIPVTIAESLYVGMFGGAVKVVGTNEWQFEKMLYIQVRTQGNYTWGPVGENTGVRDYSDGKDNTLKLYNRANNYPAAEACFTKNSNYTSINAVGHANYHWYLPAQRQLMAAWVSHNSFSTAYKLSTVLYRSATEYDASYAWHGHFGQGATTSSNDKAYLAWVRCVREVTP
jgi:hypothetical protein